MIRFKQFILENKDSLSKSQIKDINIELFNLVKNSSSFDSSQDMINFITSKLQELGISIISSGRIITNSKTKTFKISEAKNIELIVNWNIMDEKFNLKDCYLK